MRKLAMVVVALAGLSVAQSASAVTQVWFQATGNNPSSLVTTQGAPGGAPLLNCNVGAPGTRCEWTIQMLMTAPAADAGITAWSNDWSSPNAPKVRVKSLTLNTALFPFNPNPGQAGTGQNLWVGATAGNTAGVDGAQALLATFVLSKIKPTVPSAPQTWAAFTTVGANEWGCNAFDATGGAVCDANSAYPLVAFGPNAPVLAQGGTIVPLPVILGINTPEPATLSLVCLGALGLLRRRR